MREQRPARQLAEFVASVSSAGTASASAQAAVEGAAEALGADVAAIVCGGEVSAATGYAEAGTLVIELEAVRPGATDAWLEVPGTGRCAAAAATLAYPPGARLVLARSGPDGFTGEETGLLRGMAEFAAMTIRMHGVLDRERAAREELERLAARQAALRRVATLVARAASAEEICSAVAQEVAQLSGADMANVLRYEPDGSATVVGGWSVHGDHLAVGMRRRVAGQGAAAAVWRRARPGRTVRFAGPPGSVADAFRRAGVLAATGSPIMVEGRLWGVVIAARTQAGLLPAEAEQRIPPFTELTAAAIANAQARARLRAGAEEQAALRRVATLVAQAAPPEKVFTAIAAEAGQLLPGADFALVGRYGPDGVIEPVGAWNRSGNPTLAVRQTGLRSSARAPISVEGRLWGMMIVTSTHENALPAGTEHHLADFTELAATAIANAQAREELSTFAGGQAALRRMATLIAHGEPPTAVFTAVAEEVGRQFAAEGGRVVRYDADGAATAVGSWSSLGVPDGGREPLGGQNVTTLVFETGRPARIDRYARDDSSSATANARRLGIRSAVGAPITVEGRLWGGLEVAISREAALPARVEERLAAFAELIATAIANAQARMDLRRHADEQAALRRVATLVARGAPPAEVFVAVTTEVGQVLAADFTGMSRYDGDDTATAVGMWTRTDAPWPMAIGDRVSLGGHNSTTLVFRTARPVRIDDYDRSSGVFASAARGWGFRSAVGVPISVQGRLWGVVTVGYAREASAPPGTEQRLVDFTELVATAIANADAQAELAASRARVVAAADETRRRIERDLHDGAQQRLVSLALQLRLAQTAVPSQLEELRTELGHVVAGLTSTLDELREYARGIHPAILTVGGLGAAVRALARRSPVPVTVVMRTGARLPQHIEVTAYYVVSEALANAAEHADASAVRVAVETIRGVVRLSVSDDGVGGADPARGSDLLALKDRIEATGGTFILHSRPGEGTRVVAELPIRPG